MLAFLSYSYLCFKLYILFGFVNHGEVKSTCARNKCCDGYFWNTESKQCEKCKPGFLGPNCTQPCPYPFYGHNCQRRCGCDRQKCHVSTGCTTGTTVTQKSAVFTNITTEKTIFLSGSRYTSMKFERLSTKEEHFTSK